MSRTETTPGPTIGTAGIINGELHLSQGITRAIAPPKEDSPGGQFTEIPVIDLSPVKCTFATPGVKSRLMAEILDACTRAGFFVIKNHGIEWRIVEDAFEATKAFFDLPMETKMDVHQSKSESYQGYEPPFYTNLDRLKKGDLKEAITTAFDPQSDTYGVRDTIMMPELLIRKNQWPNAEHAPRFRPAIEAYRAACLNLAKQLMRIIAVGIGQGEDFFDKKSSYPVAGIRALYYPPQPDTDREATGLGAHTDIQMITLIAQSPPTSQALEVLNSSGEWIRPLLPSRETFIVNLGDMVARLTNDVLVSTVHRVRNPPSTDKTGRYSLPFFFGVNQDELITTLPQFITPERPLRKEYESAVTGYEHFHKRLRRAHEKNEGAKGRLEAGLPKGMAKVDGVVIQD